MQPRFRAGYDFLRLRADVGEVDAAMAEWWEDYHLGNDDEREALVHAAREVAVPRRVPRAVAAPQADAVGDATPVPSDEAFAPARKRRRRRRKPGDGAARSDDAPAS